MTTETGQGVAGSPEAPPDPHLSPRRERTRERLLDAAFDVFSRLGVQASSIEAICEAAGFTRGAFYSNFATKEELLLALVDRDERARLQSLEATVAALGDRIVDGDTVRPDAIRSVVTAVMGDPDDERRWHLVRAEFELMALRDPDIAQQYVAQQTGIRQELTDAIRRVLESIGLRFVVPEGEAVDLLITAYEAAAQRAFLSGRDVAEEAPAGTLAPLVRLLVTEA